MKKVFAVLVILWFFFGSGTIIQGTGRDIGISRSPSGAIATSATTNEPFAGVQPEPLLPPYLSPVEGTEQQEPSPATTIAPSSSSGTTKIDLKAITFRRTLVFEGPGTKYNSCGILQKGCTIRVLEEKEGWYRISSKQYPSGWIPKVATSCR